VNETRSREPLERDKHGARILTHGEGGYKRGCGCPVCLKGHAEAEGGRRKARSGTTGHSVTGRENWREQRPSVRLADDVMELVEQARGVTPRGQWLRDAVHEKLARDLGIDVDDLDTARRPARRRANRSGQQQAGTGTGAPAPKEKEMTGHRAETVAAAVVEITASSRKSLEFVTIQEERHGRFWMRDAAPGTFETGQPVSVHLHDGSVIDVQAREEGQQS
jgi:hypothetical protein